MGQVFANSPRPSLLPSSGEFRSCLSCVLDNGDRCTLENFVVASNTASLVIGRVEEIIQAVSSCSGDPDAILVRVYNDVPQLGNRENVYDMPYLVPTQHYILGNSQVSTVDANRHVHAR